MIKDEEDKFDAGVGNWEDKKIHKQVVEYTTPIINAMTELPIYYRCHIKTGLKLGKIKDQKEDKINIKRIKQNLNVTRALLRANNKILNVMRISKDAKRLKRRRMYRSSW